MQKRHYIGIGCLLLALAAVLVWQRAAQPKPVPIEVLRPSEVNLDLGLTGRLQAQDRVTVAPLLSSRVEALHAEEGAMVKSGQLLATVSVLALSAQNEQARALRNQAAAQVAQLEQDLARERRLQQQGFLSDAALARRESELAQARAALAASTAGTRETVAKQQETRILAPMDGIVLRRLADPGAIVDGRNGIMELASPHTQLLEADIDEAIADQLRPGMAAKIRWQDKQLDGSVSYLAPDVDTATGGRLVRITPKQSLAAPIGRSMDLIIRVATLPDSITIPRSALLSGSTAQAAAQGTGEVLVLQGDKAVRRTIRFRDWPAERVAVLAGLRAGEQLVLSPRAVPAPPLRGVVTE
ncbi:efflux RND transporter periplasmic adaptor subunit [Chitinimonas sp. BJYL2]|uniref:efflux RND transporter periplasmic adaptor subunit n=1 Tax=Chitinimonas sp. BJYL2 TaxID=2976696 RepID=UPI0022B5786A|nr:efflux RND transporter periplasmic adaptor subunit [Chitinimonas sp. BJYL2]